MVWQNLTQGLNISIFDVTLNLNHINNFIFNLQLQIPYHSSHKEVQKIMLLSSNYIINTRVYYLNIKRNACWTRWHMPLISAFRRLQWKDQVQTQGKPSLHRMTISQNKQNPHHHNQQNKNSKIKITIKYCFYNTDEPSKLLY